MDDRGSWWAPRPSGIGEGGLARRVSGRPRADLPDTGRDQPIGVVITLKTEPPLASRALRSSRIVETGE